MLLLLKALVLVINLSSTESVDTNILSNLEYKEWNKLSVHILLPFALYLIIPCNEVKIAYFTSKFKWFKLFIKVSCERLITLYSLFKYFCK